MADVRLSGVEKRYGDTRALGPVDLHVDDGEFFTLVGPSGCGKTTTLRLVAGFEAPTAGEVTIGERSMASVPPEKRDVGVVPQQYALFPHMSVRENVRYPLKFRDPPGGDADARVDDLLDLVGLTGLGDRDPEDLSGGQRQRVALARALAPSPELLLLDEPMSALDARLRERLRREVRRIQRELGVTTVYVTHDQEEALAVSDRVAVMNDGRVEQVGTPREVYDAPATRFTAAFVGENNLFDGEVVERVAGESVPAADGGQPDSLARVRLDRLDATVTVTHDAAVGAQAAFSVRPEAFTLAAGGGEHGNTFTGQVRETEFLGTATRLTVDCGDVSLVVRLAADAIPSGTVTVEFEPDAARPL
ncbi:ABC transporter ATP-binding protein [Halomarina oriensis]|uniref:Molybdate/tungstate import ATP-binding protein WtpC n=1 Tax=Halomarina oriensis TaxID=671145 RepID=A0A6B0GQC4_9EURY|nr:ABC transporter ATP-binding protein [Halomarina oriensis]MWG34863.1 ATP-binding cassette domain-containing protein [Halomarina oriensis]